MGRAVLKTLKQTTLLTFLDVAKSWGLKQSKQGLPPYTFNYNEQQGEITFWNGSAIHLKDLAYYPSDPEYDSLGSTEYTGAFIDEANQVRSKAKEIITVRVRYRLDEFGLTPKLLMTCNSAKNWVYSEFYKPNRDGKLDEWKAFIQALPTDNPHLAQATIESMKRIKDKATKERLLFGNWEYDDDPLALFDAPSLYDLFTNTFLQESPRHYISCDAARLGRDLCVIMVWEGMKVVHITTYPTSRLTQIESEIERLRQIYSVPRSQVIIDEDGVGCILKGMQLLTSKGWKSVEEIIEGDGIYSQDESGNVIIEQVTGVRTLDDQECLETDKGYVFSRGHLVRHKSRVEKNWQLSYWEDIVEKRMVYLDNSFRWAGKDQDFVLRNHVITMPNGGKRKYNNALRVPISVFAPFLAWFISEGCISGKYIIISQSNNSVHNESIMRCLRSCGLAFYTKTSKAGEISYAIGNRKLRDWLMEHCYVSGDRRSAHTKRVPNIVKNATPQTIRLFLDAYRDGDGYLKDGVNYYVTASPMLANDLHELVLKSGKYANTRVKQQIDSVSTIHGRPIKRTGPVYQVYEWNSARITLRPKLRSRFLSTVYDVHVSGETRLYMVRGKDGRAFWVHNGGIVDHLPGVKGFTANAAPIQDPTKRDESNVDDTREYKLNYDKLKTQCYHLLADKVNAGLISVPVATPEEQTSIIEELEQVKSKNADKDAKIQIVSKEEIKESLGRSPDFSDCMMMKMVFDLTPTRQPVFGFSG